MSIFCGCVMLEQVLSNLLALLLEGEDRGEGGALGYCPHPRPLPRMRAYAGEGIDERKPLRGHFVEDRRKVACCRRKKTNC